jgi:hypothetical protein
MFVLIYQLLPYSNRNNYTGGGGVPWSSLVVNGQQHNSFTRLNSNVVCIIRTEWLFKYSAYNKTDLWDNAG